MIDRICSCCGQSYTDEEGHDYEQCVIDCERRIKKAEDNLVDARRCLGMAQSRREAQTDYNPRN